MDNTEMDDLILRVLSGSFTSTELECLAEWCGQSSANMEYFRRYKKLCNLTTGVRPGAVEVEASFSALKAHNSQALQSKALFRRRILNITAGAAIAALIAVAVLAGLHFTAEPVTATRLYEAYPRDEGISLQLADGTIVDVEAVAGDHGREMLPENCGHIAVLPGVLEYTVGEEELHREVTINTLRVGRGKRYMVALADGTKVWMNSGSTLTYPEVFAGQSREVAMTGECYFDVATDRQKPFIVRAAGLTAEVLGTAFNVSAYENEPTRSITLVRGSVKALSQNASLVMNPGMRVVLETTGGAMTSLRVDPAQYTCWMEGRNIFRDATIGQIIAKMELIYDVRIENRAGLDGGMRFNGQFDNMDVESSVRSLCLNTGTEYTYDRNAGLFRITNNP